LEFRRVLFRSFTLNVGGAAKAEASEGDPGLYRISRGGKSCSWHEPRCPPDHLHLRFAIGLGVQTERARCPLGHVAGEVVDALGRAVVRKTLGGGGYRVAVPLLRCRGHVCPGFYGELETALLARIGTALIQALIIPPHEGPALLAAGSELPLLFRGQSSSDPSAVSGGLMPVDAGDGMVFTAGVMAGAGEIQEGLGVLPDLEALKIPRTPGGGAGAGCDAGVVLGGGDLVLLDGEGLDGDLMLRELTEGAEGKPHHEGAAFDVNEGRWLERRLRPLGLPR